MQTHPQFDWFHISKLNLVNKISYKKREREKNIQVGERDSKEMRFLSLAKSNQIEPY